MNKQSKTTEHINENTTNNKQTFFVCVSICSCFDFSFQKLIIETGQTGSKQNRQGNKQKTKRKSNKQTNKHNTTKQ